MPTNVTCVAICDPPGRAHVRSELEKAGANVALVLVKGRPAFVVDRDGMAFRVDRAGKLLGKYGGAAAFRAGNYLVSSARGKWHITKSSTGAGFARDDDNYDPLTVGYWTGLPGPPLVLPVVEHIYMCENGHLVRLPSNDSRKVCPEDGTPLSR